jgi:hypothetical protein
VAVFQHPNEVRKQVQFASRLGAEYITVNFDPTDRQVSEELVAAADEFEVMVAIHNISTTDPVELFSSTDEIEGYLEDVSHPRIRCCIDTGHVILEDETLETAFRRLGPYVDVVHLKGERYGSSQFSLDAEEDLSKFLDLFETYTESSLIVLEHRTDGGGLTESLGRITRSLGGTIG